MNMKDVSTIKEGDKMNYNEVTTMKLEGHSDLSSN